MRLWTLGPKITYLASCTTRKRPLNITHVVAMNFEKGPFRRACKRYISYTKNVVGANLLHEQEHVIHVFPICVCGKLLWEPIQGIYCMNLLE